MADDGNRFLVEAQDELLEIMDLLLVLQNSVAFLGAELPNHKIDAHQTLFRILDERLQGLLSKIEQQTE